MGRMGRMGRGVGGRGTFSDYLDYPLASCTHHIYICSASSPMILLCLTVAGSGRGLRHAFGTVYNPLTGAAPPVCGSVLWMSALLPCPFWVHAFRLVLLFNSTREHRFEGVEPLPSD